jgi:hypothetical protein
MAPMISRYKPSSMPGKLENAVKMTLNKAMQVMGNNKKTAGF